jgi:hypothetical protein
LPDETDRAAEPQRGSAGIEARPIRSVADDNHVPWGPPGSVAGERLEQVFVALPVAQRRDDA